VIVGLLLAAGGSRRFGSQKLIATLDHKPLVRHAADALARVTDELIVVVGSDADAVIAALDGLNARIVENPEWERGLSSSIRSGIAAAPPNSSAVLIALGDEPRVRGDVSREVISAWRTTGQPVVVARYAGVTGHPVLFDASIFDELMTLDGDVGAKRVIARRAERVVYVDINETPPLDVDEPADLRKLK
jgi:molybdenum cofactor cytidylyltransferase